MRDEEVPEGRSYPGDSVTCEDGKRHLPEAERLPSRRLLVVGGSFPFKTRDRQRVHGVCIPARHRINTKPRTKFRKHTSGGAFRNVRRGKGTIRSSPRCSGFVLGHEVPGQAKAQALYPGTTSQLAKKNLLARVSILRPLSRGAAPRRNVISAPEVERAPPAWLGPPSGHWSKPPPEVRDRSRLPRPEASGTRCATPPSFPGRCAPSVLPTPADQGSGFQRCRP
jgi:hypothetical protein